MTDLTTAPATGTAAAQLPSIIQGGMGVGISTWELARAVSVAGQLGVVSGVALDVVLARRLQDGDAGGHVRRALARFPSREIADRIVDRFFVAGGIGDGAPYRAVPRHTFSSMSWLVELTVAAGFVEVHLAKEGHDGPVGINLMRKVGLPLPATLYGAMLAGVDVVLVGAGNPAEIPALTRSLACHDDVRLDVKVTGARAADRVGELAFSPRTVLPQAMSNLRRPATLAIVASVDLARMLADSEVSRPDGFVVEGPTAGGHNAPPRGPRRYDETGQPVYGERDEVDHAALRAIGLPFWLAGAYADAGRLRAALALGAHGVQIGTAFAYCDESGMEAGLKERARRRAVDGTLAVRSDPRISPTGFPFQVAELEGTIADPETAGARMPVCDLGFLRSAYLRPDGGVAFRCPAEPRAQFLRHGGAEMATAGRACLCNALLATAGLPQRRPNGGVEAPLVTSGTALGPVRRLSLRAGRADGGYTAREVIAEVGRGLRGMPEI